MLLVSLNVPYVASAFSPSGAGLCWAACIAAIGNYRLGLTGSWAATALGLYSELDYNYSGTPTGAQPWFSRGFSEFGLSSTYVLSGMSFSSVNTQLSANKPIHLGISRSGGSHGIVCKGLESASSFTSYVFMDPNFSASRWINVSGQNQSINNSSFSYVGSYTYTNWYESIY